MAHFSGGMQSTLYRPEFERDNCGFGLIANMDGDASHWLVNTAIEALERMTHRGGIAADGVTGDGCGLLLAKPDSFLRTVAAELNIAVADQYAVGTVFLDQDEAIADVSRKALEAELLATGVEIAGWRVVPVDPAICGEQALASLPQIEQIFVNAPEGMTDHQFQQKLFIARRKVAVAMAAAGDNNFYVVSLTPHVIAYKGLVMPEAIASFYKDLGDERLESKVAVFHQRFSTNTTPQWKLAQPFRYLAHNGEINTIRGNRNWAIARSFKLEAEGLPIDELRPLVNLTGSDSSSLDNMLEVMLAGGMDIFRSMRMLVPPAWQNTYDMDPDLRAFYEVNSFHMEPWDGPAGIVLTDGRYAACTLDRNGLRPARYVVTKDRHITLASEVGVWSYKPEDVEAKGRLKPGQMLAADTHTGELLLPEDIDNIVKSGHPYKDWLKQGMRHLEASLIEADVGNMDADTFQVFQKMYLLSFEERDQVLRVLAEAGQEAIGSMGDDTPFAVLSENQRSLYDYFRQQFAQVTNPPIDPLREQIVMSLETNFGRERNIFDPSPAHAELLKVGSPVLSPKKFQKLVELDDPDFQSVIIDLNYPEDGDLKAAIVSITDQAEAAVRAGNSVIILSDRAIEAGRLPVHALMATGAVHHRLVKTGLRCDANLVIDTATARDSHHFACLIGYGATAIHPYLAYETLHDMRHRSGEITDDFASDQLRKSFRKGINKGLYKIMSKMGISTIASYRGAQLFEAVGLDDDIVDLCFTGTVSRLKGADFDDLHNDQAETAKIAWTKRKTIDQGGLLKYVHGGEYHAYNPDVVQTLQAAVQSGRWTDYQKYAQLVNERPVATLRDLFKVNSDREAISIDDVEPAEALYKRFDSAGMSLGALSPEAHEALAIAMNRLGGRSNSGEGGEAVERYGNEKVSKIKQIASGRFGVTPHYLVNAEVLQIKVAQGAKPGEGGQLPGHKVVGIISKLRYATPGVALISPPPHHDIYSIEDLAQLIFDLKQVNPKALVSVKLVAEPGVGTIAAGVAKAYADLITISGYDGGTGASPLTSVRYAGTPFELGLSETHQTLRANDLRDKVRVQTDGGLKTGLDVVKAAILGAESFGFGTGPMVALGCKYLRICHLNNCATGVATQNNVLRMKHFIGLPEMVMNYFKFIAQEVRELLASMGYSSLEEIVGQTHLLEILEGNTSKQRKLDLSPILSSGDLVDKAQYCLSPQNNPHDEGLLAEQMVTDMLSAIDTKSGGEFSYEIRNTDRSVGARLSGEIATRHGNHGMSDAPLKVELNGTAGQSFGVWNAGGLEMTINGDANDYVGKGMAGGKLIVRPPQGSTFRSNETSIIGNTCLYGATGGTLYAAGIAGERFGVRNSGAVAVVEGVGDHGCEYMTGGVMTILGNTGVNFGAGMTGGFAYVLDMDRTFVDCYNHELIDIHRITSEAMEAHSHYLISQIQDFVNATGSAWGQTILDDFRSFAGRFWLVKPKAADVNSLIDSLRDAA